MRMIKWPVQALPITKLHVTTEEVLVRQFAACVSCSLPFPVTAQHGRNFWTELYWQLLRVYRRKGEAGVIFLAPYNSCSVRYPVCSCQSCVVYWIEMAHSISELPWQWWWTSSFCGRVEYLEQCNTCWLHQNLIYFGSVPQIMKYTVSRCMNLLSVQSADLSWLLI